MSNEIATYSMILNKLNLGKSGAECPTKTQILAVSSLIIIDNASTYGANECVKIDDIRKKAETWNYYLTVSPTSMSFGTDGGSKSFTVSSYKRKVLDGVEQSGNTNVSLKSTTISGTGFSLSGTTVSASANEGTSNRTGTVTITQNESNKTATISLSQSGDAISSYGEWIISVSANPTMVPESGGTSTITATAKRTVYWTSGATTEETGNPTLTTNLGTLSGNILTLGAYTASGSRAATITATYAGKSAICRVAQNGSGTNVSYTFSVNPYKVSVGAGGGTGSVTISSYKTVGSSTYDVDYNIDSSTLPSWASFNKSTSTFTIQSTTSTVGRTAKVYFDQAESGERDYAELTQTGYTPPADNYVFTWGDGTTADQSISLPYQGSSAASDFVVISTKNGSSQSWSVSSKPSWITTSTINSSVTISASNNSGSARSGEVVLTQSGSGKTLTVNVSQDAKPADEYVFEIADSSSGPYGSSVSWTLPASGLLNKDIYLRSKKNGEDVGWSASSNASWIIVVRDYPDFYWEYQNNNSTSSRSGKITFTQEGSGKKVYLNLTQEGKAQITLTVTLNDTVIDTQSWDVPTQSTTKTYSVSTPSAGWSESDKLKLGLHHSLEGAGIWTGMDHTFRSIPLKDETHTLSIGDKYSEITFNIVYSIEGAAVFTFADGSTFKKQYSISQGDTHIYDTGITPFISTVFGKKADYNMGSVQNDIEVIRRADYSVKVIVSKNTTGQPRTLFQEWIQSESGRTIRFEVDQAA